MIDYKVLKRLVMEVIHANPYKPVCELIPDVEKLAAYNNIFPSKADGDNRNRDYGHYRGKRLSPIDKQNINRIIWHLIRENLMVIDKDRLN